MQAQLPVARTIIFLECVGAFAFHYLVVACHPISPRLHPNSMGVCIERVTKVGGHKSYGNIIDNQFCFNFFFFFWGGGGGTMPLSR